MSVDFESAARLNALKSGIEAKTGESYTDLTGGVNALIAGFGQGGSGGGVLSGNFTPAEPTYKVTLNFDSPITGIIIIKHTASFGTSAATTFYGVVYVSGIGAFAVHSNMANNTWTIMGAGLDKVGLKISDDGTSVEMTATRFFVTEQYDWIAW